MTASSVTSDQVEAPKIFRSIYEPVSEEDYDLVERSKWMIRNCMNYDYEYSECFRPRGRLYQLYIDGQFEDCKPQLTLKKQCRYWEKGNVVAGANIIRYEKQNIERRLQSRKNNDVLTFREERPPSNWNCPLPAHITDTYPNSYLLKEAQLIPNNDYHPPSRPSYCTIM